MSIHSQDLLGLLLTGGRILPDLDDMFNTEGSSIKGLLPFFVHGLI